VIERHLRSRIERELERFPAVALLGPRQVGKTTLALEIAAARAVDAVYLDLERPADLRRLADPDAYLRSQAGKLVIIDEIHRVPELFPTLRGVIDARRRAGDRSGHFLLLGSASLELVQQTSETLAGRIAYLELAPVDATEYSGGTSSGDRLWNRGGFPDSLLAADDAGSLAWRRAFVRSYLERDVPMFAPRMPAETIGRLWTMLAHGQGTLLNQSRLAQSLAVSVPTVARYLDLLVDLLLVRRLRPWSGNAAKRLVKSPKTYIRDSGLTHALLDLESLDDVLGHPVAGPSWEGFVIENLIGAAGARRTPYFYRTADGAEVDLLFERGGRVEMAIEIKRSTAPVLSRGFHTARAVLNPDKAYVVHGGDDTWPLEDGITAISLPALMQSLAA
jgi:predicted AAA+ superfamily ATPase